MSISFSDYHDAYDADRALTNDKLEEARANLLDIHQSHIDAIERTARKLTIAVFAIAAICLLESVVLLGCVLGSAKVLSW